jgi:apolipoprotein N-acyltransferase
VIQGNYVLEVQIGGGPNKTNDKRNTYDRLIRQAAGKQPDVFVLPESPWPMILNKEYLEHQSVPPPPGQDWSQYCHDWLSAVAESTGAYLVTGAFSQEFYPEQDYPTEGRFNSAFVFPPDKGEVKRYDKVHLVLFGEYVPLRGGKLHFVYRWLNDITPWGQDGFEYSIFPGDAFHVFELAPKSQPGRRYHFGIPICYEDVMPYIARAFSRVEAGKKSADFLLNIRRRACFARWRTGWGSRGR